MDAGARLLQDSASAALVAARQRVWGPSSAAVQDVYAQVPGFEPWGSAATILGSVADGRTRGPEWETLRARSPYPAGCNCDEVDAAIERKKNDVIKFCYGAERRDIEFGEPVVTATPADKGCTTCEFTFAWACGTNNGKKQGSATCCPAAFVDGTAYSGGVQYTSGQPTQDCHGIQSRKSDPFCGTSYTYGYGQERPCGCVSVKELDTPGAAAVKVRMLRQAIAPTAAEWTASDIAFSRKNPGDADQFGEYRCASLVDIQAAAQHAVYQRMIELAWELVVQNYDLVQLAVCQVVGPDKGEQIRFALQGNNVQAVWIGVHKSTTRGETTEATVLDLSTDILINCDGDLGMVGVVRHTNGNPWAIESAFNWYCIRFRLAALLVHEIFHANFVGYGDNSPDTGFDACAPPSLVQRLFQYFMAQRYPSFRTCGE